MRAPNGFLSGFAATGLLAVIASGVWLIVRELGVPAIAEFPANSEWRGDHLDAVRTRLYELRERHQRNSALNLGGQYKSSLASLESLQRWVQDTALRLGQSLRPSPPKAFEPEAFFVSYLPGSSRMKLVTWSVKEGRALYTFKITHSHSDLIDEVAFDVRKGDPVGEVRLVSSTSPTIVGGSWEQIVRVTARGNEIRKKVKLPNFRIVRLSLECRSNPSENFVLEAAYSEGDIQKAEQSGYSFKDFIEWEIPLATIALRDEPDGDIRSVTAKEGSKFVFVGREYQVRSIRPAHIELFPTDEKDTVLIWPLVDPQ